MGEFSGYRPRGNTQRKARIFARKISLTGVVLLVVLGCKLDFPNPSDLLADQGERGLNTRSITAFSFPTLGAIGAIDQRLKTIVVTVPYGTELTALVATFTTTGASVTVGRNRQTLTV